MRLSGKPWYRGDSGVRCLPGAGTPDGGDGLPQHSCSLYEKGNQGEVGVYHNIHVVYTKEAETADQYIEKFAHENGRKYTVMVATSDRLEQIIIRGQGCGLYSARDFEEEVDRVKNQTREHTNRPHSGHKNYLLDSVPEEVLRQVKKDE